MPDVEKLADAAEVIVQGYAFIDRGEGVTVINLHKPDHAAYFYNNELVETNMDDSGKGRGPRRGRQRRRFQG